MDNVIRFDFDPQKEFISDWISKDIDKNCVDYLENMGFYLCDKQKIGDRFPGFKAVTTSQLRNVFEEVKRIQIALEGSTTFEEVQTDILLLRPKIAYNAARVLSKTRDSRIDAFRKFAETALLEVTKPLTIKVKNDKGEEEAKDMRPEKYKRFCQLMEGIIAYHKVYGGKD